MSDDRELERNATPGERIAGLFAKYMPFTKAVLLAKMIDEEVDALKVRPIPKTAPPTPGSTPIEDPMIYHENDKGGTRASEVAHNAGGHNFVFVRGGPTWADRKCTLCGMVVWTYASEGYPICKQVPAKKSCGCCGKPGGGNCPASSTYRVRIADALVAIDDLTDESPIAEIQVAWENLRAACRVTA